MSIQITITAGNAAEAVQLVQDLAGTMSGMDPADIPAKAAVSKVDVKPDKASSKKSAKKEDDPAPEQVVEVTKETEADEPNEVIPTDVELRALAQEKGKEKGKPAVKALLDEFEAPNVTAVPDDRRLEFKQRLEKL